VAVLRVVLRQRCMYSSRVVGRRKREVLRMYCTSSLYVTSRLTVT
jgi:hypothetical protein